MVPKFWVPKVPKIWVPYTSERHDHIILYARAGIHAIISNRAMVDTLNLRCERTQFGNDATLSVCNHIDIEREGIMASGERYVIGHVKNYRVYADERRVRLSGSIAKLIRGTNVGTLDREEVRYGIEFLSDVLHLDIGRAIVSRIDVAYTFHVEESPGAYIEQMLRYDGMTKASVNTETLYFASKKKVLCFYNKKVEMEERGVKMPLWGKKNELLRYELRLMANVGHQIGLKKTITASEIDQPDIWLRLVNKWADEYRNIEKDVSMGIRAANTAREAYMAIYADLLCRFQGDYMQKAIELTKRGTMTKKERYRLKQMIKEVENTCLYTKLNSMIENVRAYEKRMLNR